MGYSEQQTGRTLQAESVASTRLPRHLPHSTSCLAFFFLPFQSAFASHMAELAGRRLVLARQGFGMPVSYSGESS
jgi:hypothetical protein